VAEREFIPLNIAVLVVSDSRTEKTDKSGKLLERRLREAGHQLFEKSIVTDDIHQIRSQVSLWTANDNVNAVLITGGTGITGRDGTPEAISVLFEKEIEGFGEMFRMLSYEEIGTSSLQSRAIAGVTNGTYIFCKHRCKCDTFDLHAETENKEDVEDNINNVYCYCVI